MGRKTNLLLTLSSVLAVSSALHEEHRVRCEKKRMCNGNMMCADVCIPETVEIDNWAAGALKYQRVLQRDSIFATQEIPGTHNSIMSEAHGFGIEKYFISALFNGYDTNQGDDVGEGVCQHLSVLDQLNMGLRHIEIDVWWWSPDEDVAVCHSPIPLWPVGKVNRMAEEAGLNLEWEPLNMCCIKNRLTFTDVLLELKGWLDENPDEFLVLYLDTKCRFIPEHVDKANQDMLDVFGDSIYRLSEGSPLNFTMNELLARGKRVLFEGNRDDWLTPATTDQIVFYPVLWEFQFSEGEFVEFPDCSIGGESGWYGKKMARALDGSFTEAATRCGVNIVSGDYVDPDEMRFFVWSWDLDEPSRTDGCTAMLPTGRWATLDCQTQLPYACRGATDTEWTVDMNKVGPWTGDNSVCPEGTTHDAPRNGYTNGKLWLSGYAQTIWLNAPSTL